MDEQNPNQDSLPGQVDVPQPADVVAPTKYQMPRAWKVAFLLLGTILALTVLTYVINPIELAGKPPVEAQWWMLIWLFAIAPTGAIALVALIVCIPVYLASKRKAVPASPVVSHASVPVTSTKSVDVWKWRSIFLILGAIIIGIPLLSMVLKAAGVDLDSSFGFALLEAGVISIAELALFILVIIYITSTTRSAKKKLIAGLTFAALAILPLFLIFSESLSTGSQDAGYSEEYYEEESSDSSSDDRYYE